MWYNAKISGIQIKYGVLIIIISIALILISISLKILFSSMLRIVDAKCPEIIKRIYYRDKELAQSVK